LPKIIIIGGVPGSLIRFRGDLIRQWINLGFEVVAVSAPAPELLEKELSALGITFKPIPLKRDQLNPFKDLIAILKLCKLIRMEKPDYIFAYTVKPIIFSAF